ncbi:type I phosphomannose isomerase catalytic subunit [Clostridium sp.]|uniref:type I phosphomannose isomerase catalytic subunit n=1 Tax=Clostridium sp. TaxID=1506 RepID=UPI002FC8C4EC
MFYPLFLTPFFKECIWGGNNLKSILGKNIPSNNTGESFEISCHTDYLCKIKSGVFKDIYLKTLVDIYPVEILGKNIDSDFFPIIVKILDARDRLSIQVHPNDRYAYNNYRSLGKNELWYVLHANKDSKIILGLKDNTSKKDIESSLSNGNISDYLNIENVSIGDCIYIPSGTVHALLENIVVLEVQQSSDLTYRLYDWDRLENGCKRKLHINNALDVINPKSKGEIIKASDYEGEYFYNLIDIKDFTVDYINLNGSLLDHPCYKSFHVYTCINGSGYIIYKGSSQPINKGDTFLIPASLKEYEIRGELTLIKVYIKK